MRKNLSQKVSNVIHHPQPYKKLAGVVGNRIGEKWNKARGALWCMPKAISAKEAVKKVTGNNQYVSFYDKFKQEIKKAESKQNACPVKMGGAGDLELLYQLCEHIQAKKVIETGVAYGWSSLAVLLSINNRKDSLLISTDLPYSALTAPYAGCVVPDNLKNKWKLIKKPDIEALPEVLKILPEIDMCHYDSDKTYAGRMFAYPLLWGALRKGGVFISDDIGDNLGFKRFSQIVGIEPIVVKTNNKYIGILIK